ncbi:MAG: hypothetical protein PHQ47_01965, partial [Candidatus Portnoybacteria bacterium]|nr:hypothetical protein [Candidatus Portnoybacteria bacterium]
MKELKDSNFWVSKALKLCLLLLVFSFFVFSSPSAQARGLFSSAFFNFWASINEAMNYLVFGQYFPASSNTIIIRKTLPEKTEKQIILAPQNQDSLAIAAKEKIIEITKVNQVNQVLGSADYQNELDFLEQRLSSQISDVKSILAQNLDSLSQDITHQVSYISAAPPVSSSVSGAPVILQRFDQLHNIQLTGTVTQTDSGQVSFAGNIDASGGLEVLAGNLGIGVSSPNNLIQVAGLINFDNSLYNTFLGYQTGNNNTTGSKNNFIGYQAGYLNTTGYTNNFFGYQAGYNTTTGYLNLFIGEKAGYANTTAGWNTAIGNFSLYSITTGEDNVAVGYKVLEQTTTGGENTAVGYKAMNLNTEGVRNTAVGNNTLRYNTTGNDNTAVGQEALLSNTEGIENVAMGVIAADRNTTGSANTVIGYKSFYWNTTGSYNTALGGRALYMNETGSFNTAVGYQAGYGTYTNSYSNNTMLGYQSGYNLSTGSNNIFLGYQTATTTTTGSNNIVIGYGINAPSATASNTLNIGNLIYGINIDGLMTTVSTGNIGIGTTTPTSKLEVAGNLKLSTTATDPVIYYSAIDDWALRITPSNANRESWVFMYPSIGETDSGIALFNNSDFTNGYMGVMDLTANAFEIKSWSYGLTYDNSLPMVFKMSNSSAGRFEALRITNAGNVGIGTTSPRSLLQIAGDKPQLTLSDTSASLDSKHWFLSSMGGNFYIGTSSDSLNATSTHLTINNLGNLGIGTTNPKAKIQVGNYTANNSVDSQILISRSADDSISGNGHAFSDSSDINRSGTIGYNSYDARITYSGSNTYDHYVSFQAMPTYGSSGTISNIYGLFANPTINTGRATNVYGAYVYNFAGSGTVDNNYGFYVENLTKGAQNFAFYADGNTKSYFGGNIGIGTTTPRSLLQIAGDKPQLTLS